MPKWSVQKHYVAEDPLDPMERKLSFCEHSSQYFLECNCGEVETEFDWTWNKDESIESSRLNFEQDNRKLLFNPAYSSGTIVVRGNKLLECNTSHYWEIKMLGPVYGTDIMVGVCKEDCNLSAGLSSFWSFIGRDAKSWGFSYNAQIQHDSVKVDYGLPWKKGSIVGIFLDTFRGSLEFFLNRQPLGVAFTGLQGMNLYPVVSSTSARSCMKLITAKKFPSGLKFLSYRTFLQNSGSSVILGLPPGLKSFAKKYYFPFVNTKMAYSKKQIQDNHHSKAIWSPRVSPRISKPSSSKRRYEVICDERDHFYSVMYQLNPACRRGYATLLQNRGVTTSYPKLDEDDDDRCLNGCGNDICETLRALHECLKVKRLKGESEREYPKLYTQQNIQKKNTDITDVVKTKMLTIFNGASTSKNLTQQESIDDLASSCSSKNVTEDGIDDSGSSCSSMDSEDELLSELKKQDKNQ